MSISISSDDGRRLRMTESERLVVGAATAPLVAPLAVVIFAAATGEGNSSALLLEFVFALLIAYAGMLLVGVPAARCLRRFGLLNLASISLAGAVGGAVVFCCFLKILGSALGSSAQFDLSALVWGASLGLLVSSAFGAIAGMTWRSSGRRLSQT